MILRAPASQLLVVREEWDVLVSQFLRYARGAGVSCNAVSLAEAANLVTLEVDEEGPPRVHPESAWFLRASGWIGTGNHDEEWRFHWMEQYSAVWAAAALTPATVVNRPSEWGWAARATSSACVAEQRAGARVRTQEVFSHKAPPEILQGCYHQDVVDARVVADPTQSSGLLRSRALPPCRGWEKVLVVGDDAFRTSSVDLAPHVLEEPSAAAARETGLKFATVSWGIPVDGSPPVLARVNAFPTMDEATPVWPEVRQALLLDLTGR